MAKKTKKGYVLFYNIQWETDGEEVELPTQVSVPLSDFEDDVDFSLEGADFLSDHYGWLVEGFEFKINKTSTKVKELTHLI